MNIDTIVYYRIVDVYKSAYRVKMIVEAVKEITYAVFYRLNIDSKNSMWWTQFIGDYRK